MRYYRYGMDRAAKEVEAEEKGPERTLGRFGDLVIDEDTVYEIDEECLRCQKEQP